MRGMMHLAVTGLYPPSVERASVGGGSPVMTRGASEEGVMGCHKRVYEGMHLAITGLYPPAVERASTDSAFVRICF